MNIAKTVSTITLIAAGLVLFRVGESLWGGFIDYTMDWARAAMYLSIASGIQRLISKV